MKLSKHFSLYEATKSRTAAKKGIKNTPDNTQIENLKNVALHILEPCRDFFMQPIRPSSWFRCYDLNALVGGGLYSQHLKGEAVDFEINGLDNRFLWEWICNNLDYDQCILEHYFEENPSSGWIHCSFKMNNNNNNRNEAFKIGGNSFF